MRNSKRNSQGCECVVDSCSSWMMSIDFIPLIKSVEYHDSYIQHLEDLRTKFSGTITKFPKEFYGTKRWTSEGLFFSSGKFEKATVSLSHPKSESLQFAVSTRVYSLVLNND